MSWGLSTAQEKVLRTIDRLGVVSTQQVIKLTGINTNTIYSNLRKLAKNKLISKVAIPLKTNLFMITQTGSEWCGRISLGYRTNQKVPNMAILRHTLIVNEMIIYYQELFKEQKNETLKITTERELLAEKIGQGKREKRMTDTVPDFVFERYTKNKTAIEVELTRKRPDRLQKKLRRYREQVKQGIYFNVCYCYDDEAVARLVKRYGDKVGLPVILDSMNEAIEDIDL